MKLFIYIVSLFALVLFYGIAFYFSNHVIINESLKTAAQSDVIQSYLGKMFMEIIGLGIVAIIFKFLLGTRPFINAIKEIFLEIFTKHSFLKDCNDRKLLSYANNITLANPNINFNHSIKDKIAIEELEKEYSKNSNGKNFIVLESTYSTTILADGIEILHRKIKCKMMDNGEFSFDYKFLPFNKEAEIKDFTAIEKDVGNRFKEASYKEILNSSDSEQAYPLKSNISIEERKNEKWIKINFSKKYTKEEEEIDIEFSISSFIDITDLSKLEEHYETSYSTPHAARHFTFQIESYKKDSGNVLSSLAPKIYIGKDNDTDYMFKQNIYYKTYSWSFHYNEHKNKPICVKVT